MDIPISGNAGRAGGAAGAFLGAQKRGPRCGGPYNGKVAVTYSPALTAVPSAQRALTALFGMGRGARPRNDRQQCLVGHDLPVGKGWVAAPRCTGRRACCWPISTARLNTLPCLHLPPINVVVYDGPKRNLISGRVSRLDAFSAYPFRTWIPGGAPGGTTGRPAVRPSRSSRTKDRAPQVSNAHHR